MPGEQDPGTAAGEDPAPPVQQGPVQQGPVQFDTSVAHIARVYDYWLGGKDNFAADREAAEQAIAANPGVRAGVLANRAFLARAVRYLTAERGVRQFLDIGTGIPTADNTHEVAQAAAPESRIVYVDNDHCKSGCTHAYRVRSDCLGVEALRAILCAPESAAARSPIWAATSSR